jgi:hypothetical protein
MATESKEMNLEDVYEFMVSVPGKKFNETDKIFCDNLYEGKTEARNFKGIKCSNYRLVGLSNDPSKKVYLKVSSIDIDNPEDFTHNLFTGLNRADVCNGEQIKKLKSTGLLNPLTTVYFKGAYTVFPSSWVERNLSKDAIEARKLDIYKSSTRGILIKVLLILKKLGLKTLVVDPEPGYLPQTSSMSHKERLDGLIKLYEDFGLKKINCALRTGAFMMLNYGDSVRGLREVSELGRNTNQDVIVMVGNINEMCEKIEKVSGIAGAVGSLFSSRVSSAREFTSIPAIESTNYKDLPYFMENPDDDMYKLKYLKYKKKYIELKKNSH